MSQGLWFGEGYNNLFGRTLNPFNVSPITLSSPSPTPTHGSSYHSLLRKVIHFVGC